MSLYHEASVVLANEDKKGGSLKSRVFSGRNLKNPPAKVYALLVESLKWSPFLKDVIEQSQILSAERKLSPAITVLLVHDLLLSKRGIAAPRNHPLRVSVEKHKARLSAEFTRCRIRQGFVSLEAFRTHVDGQIKGPDRNETSYYLHPRWARVNSLRTTLKEQLQIAFRGYREADSLEEVLQASPKEKLLYVDHTIPDLVAVPPGHDLSQVGAYRNGELIIQDKASCFPAYLLSPTICAGDVIDTCAAPGNKTTHIAALLSSVASSGIPRKVFAFERNPQRSQILKTMVTRAGGDDIITVFGNKDFLTVALNSDQFKNVEALLLDPSCSGTGIIGRDDEPTMHLPSPGKGQNIGRPAKKRKETFAEDLQPPTLEDSATVDEENEAAQDATSLTERLRALSAFQLQLVERAMHFPQASRITYSTCSIHAEENESVVIRALSSQVALDRGWRILRREEQPIGLRKWHVRGDLKACDSLETSLSNVSAAEVAEACIRCEKGTQDGTMGFFVAGFVRSRGRITIGEQNISKPSEIDFEEDEEWGGFSGAE